MMKRLLAALAFVLLASPVLGQSVEGSEINELPAVTTPADTDMLPTDQVGAAETRKITRAQIVAGVLALLQAHEAATGVHGITAFIETVLDDATAADARTTLGLGTAAVSNTGDFEAAGAVATHEADTTSVHGIADTSALLDSGDIGSTVQAQDAELAAIAGLTSATGKGIEFTGSGTAATFDLTTAGKALLDDASATAQLTTLGLAPQGSGNGLDADTVDGSHASAFAASSHAHAASDVTSGTLAHERGGLESDVSAADGIPHITGGATSIIAPGTSAQVLTSNGAGVAPTFQDAAGGGIGGSLGATDNAIVRTDGTGGETAQGSTATLNDSGHIDVTRYKLQGGSIAYYSGSNLQIEAGYSTTNINISAIGSSIVTVGANASTATTGNPVWVPGGLRSTRLVEANTAVAASPNVIAATESGTCFNNTGATALNVHTLPAAAAGLTYCGCVTDSDGIEFGAVGDDTIRDGASVTGAAGTITSTTVGDCLQLTAMDSASWYVTSANPAAHGWTTSAP